MKRHLIFRVTPPKKDHNFDNQPYPYIILKLRGSTPHRPKQEQSIGDRNLAITTTATTDFTASIIAVLLPVYYHDVLPLLCPVQLLVLLLLPCHDYSHDPYYYYYYNHSYYCITTTPTSITTIFLTAIITYIVTCAYGLMHNKQQRSGAAQNRKR